MTVTPQCKFCFRVDFSFAAIKQISLQNELSQTSFQWPRETDTVSQRRCAKTQSTNPQSLRVFVPDE